MAAASTTRSVAYAGELLERSAELAALEDALAGSRDDASGRLVLISGEAGVGKTALVRAFCDDQCGRVLWGSCDALFTPRPLGPFVDIAVQTGGELDETVHGDAEPYDVAGAVIKELEARSPTILVLDDLHWADEATLDVLTLLGRRIDRLGATVVLATYRDDELTACHPLRVVAGELARGDATSALEVEPLSPDAVARLAAPHDVEPGELYQRTGGNPFYVTEALAAGGQEIPVTVRAAVLARAGRVSSAGRQVLEAAAVFPDGCERLLLETLAPDEIASLDECFAAGILVDEGVAVRFRHELARLALEETIEPSRKLQLHRKALDALASSPLDDHDPARLAHHADGAGDADAVLRFAPAAALRASSLGAHREAAAQYARALRFADGLPVPERAWLLERRSYECYLTDDSGDAIDAINGALELYRASGDRLNEGRSLWWLSYILWCPGRTTESARAAWAAVELLETLPPGSELAMAYGNLSNTYLTQGRHAEAAEWGRRALELARRVGDRRTEAYSLGTLGLADPSARGYLEKSLELAEREGLGEQAARAFILLVAIATDVHAHADARRWVERGIAYCSERGIELHRLYLLGYLARLELAEGRWEEAADTASAVIRIPRSSTTPRIVSLSVLALVRARRGDPETHPLLDEAWALAEPTDELPRLGRVAVARAEVFWLEGNHQGVLGATDAAFELAKRQQSPWFAGELACWRRRARAQEAVPEQVPEPYARQLAGDWQGAEELWTSLGSPYEAALALADADEPEPLWEALERLTEMGARPAAAVVARKLRDLGERGLPRGPRPATRSNAAGLTSRQQEVLVLIAEGMRNGDIAQRLVVSQKTVDHHVSAILRKLQVRTRIEATARADELGLLAQDR